jgi:hypothetical protein
MVVASPRANAVGDEAPIVLALTALLTIPYDGDALALWLSMEDARSTDVAFRVEIYL